MEARPDHLARIRRDNVLHSLRQHDWIFRLEELVELAGIPGFQELEAVQRRTAELDRLASLMSVPD